MPAVMAARCQRPVTGAGAPYHVKRRSLLATISYQDLLEPGRVDASGRTGGRARAPNNRCEKAPTHAP